MEFQTHIRACPEELLFTCLGGLTLSYVIFRVARAPHFTEKPEQLGSIHNFMLSGFTPRRPPTSTAVAAVWPASTSANIRKWSSASTPIGAEQYLQRRAKPKAHDRAKPKASLLISSLSCKDPRNPEGFYQMMPIKTLDAHSPRSMPQIGALNQSMAAPRPLTHNASGNCYAHTPSYGIRNGQSAPGWQQVA